MAQSNVIVRLSLKDADAVQRGLTALGADGEKALKRIEAAGRMPSAGLKALGAASDELKEKFGELRGQAGTVGTVLETLGPRGLLAAAGVGAVVVAFGAAIRQADKAAQTFADLKDASERIGTSATALSAIEDVFTANASSAEEARAALEHLRATIAEAAGGSADAQQKFAAVGVSMDYLSKHGGDASQVLVEIARNTDITSSQVQDLVGRAGKGLVPALAALRDSGIDFNDDALEPMAKSLGELNDRSELLDRQFDKLGADGAVQVKTAMLELKQALFDVEGWFLRTAEAGHRFWEQVLDPTAWASLDAMRGTLRRATGLEAGPAAAELPAASASLPAAPAAPMTILPPVDPNAAQKARAVTDKAAAQVEKEIAAIARWKQAYLQATGDVEEALAARYQHDVRAAVAEIKDASRLAEAKELIQATFAEQLEKIDRDKNVALAQAARELQEQLAKIDDEIAGQRIAGLRATGRQTLALTEELQQKIAAIETGGGTWEQQQALIGYAREQAMREQAASGDAELAKALAKAQDDNLFSTQNVTEAANQLGLSFTSAFEDAVAGGKKFQEVLAGLGQDIEKILIRQTVTRPLEGAFASLTGSIAPTLSSLFGSNSEPVTQAKFGRVQGMTLADLTGPALARESAADKPANFGDWLSGLFGASDDAAAKTSGAAEQLAGSAEDLGTRGAAGDLSASGNNLVGIIGQAMSAMVGAISSAAGGGSAGGGLGGVFAGLFGGGGAEGLTMSGVGEGGGIDTSYMLAAHGAVFEHGKLVPFARGGIVHRPTLFPMARGGTGLMGEAGPEAVMPLRRSASGDLGVVAGGGAQVTVNIINNAGAKVMTEERREDNGALRIDVMIDAIEHAMAQLATRPGTTLNRALAQAANPVRAR